VPLTRRHPLADILPRVPRIPGIPTTLLIAPDSFKGTFTAREVAEAVAAGARDAGGETDVCPVADGGEGTLDALAPALGAELHVAGVSDPLRRPIEARFGLVGASSGLLPRAGAWAGAGAGTSATPSPPTRSAPAS
jgi:glycerate kinase